VRTGRSGALGLAFACAAVLVAGCTGDDPGPAAASQSPTSPPRLGGATPKQHPVPGGSMNEMERPVAERLAAQVADQGLSLEFLDCPAWDGDVPRRMVCKAYVDGLVARVLVRLKVSSTGQAVGFDAELDEGIIATRTLEDTLRGQGWQDPDCGEVAAYPAIVGHQLVCRVSRDGDARFVVATVEDRSGTVTISDYRSTR
jgi:hypothetical protein